MVEANEIGKVTKDAENRTYRVFRPVCVVGVVRLVGVLVFRHTA